jgi:hypothetical protein
MSVIVPGSAWNVLDGAVQVLAAWMLLPAAIPPGATVGVSQVDHFPPEIIASDSIYFLYDGYTDLEQRGPGVILRTHHLRIRLLCVRSIDDKATEMAFLTYVNAIANCYKINRRIDVGDGSGPRINTSTLTQSTGPSAPPPYLEWEGVLFRQMEWVLEATEQVQFSFH